MQAELYARKSLVSYESPIQQPTSNYETIHGRRYFECQPLRCKLSVESCGDNFARGRCLPCLDCAVGRQHAATVTSKDRPQSNKNDYLNLRASIGVPCIRCGEHHTGRLMAASFCVRCWNRSLELLTGRNCKGNWPSQTAKKLRHVEALIEADPKQLAIFLSGKFCQTRVLRWTRIDAGGVLLEGILSSLSELQALLSRILPGATVADFTEAAILPPAP